MGETKERPGVIGRNLREKMGRQVVKKEERKKVRKEKK